MVVPERCGKSCGQFLNLLEVECKPCLQKNQSSLHNEGSERGPSQNNECGKHSPVSHSRVTPKEISTSWSQMHKVNNVHNTQRLSVEVIPASFHKNRQIVLVVMYQFLDFHGLKMCQNLLV